MPIPVVPSNGHYLTLEDVKKHAVIDDDVHSCPTRVISLENTIGGLIIPLDEVRRISAFARDNNIRMHLDGARLWEAVAAGAGSLTDYAACFDTLSLCFSKGLGAPIGSAVVGPASVVKHARWMRKAIGGGLRQSGVVTAPARVALDRTFGRAPNGEGGLLRAAQENATRVAKLWTDLGGKLTYPVQTNMIWLDLESMGCSGERFNELGLQEGLKLAGTRIIIHYQVGEEAIQRLTRVFGKVAEEKAAGAAANGGSGGLYKATA